MPVAASDGMSLDTPTSLAAMRIRYHTAGVVLLGSIGAAIAFGMQLVELRIVQLSSGLTLSVAGTLKELLTVVMSALCLGDVLTGYNMAGLALCLVGMGLYTQIKHSEEVSRRTATPS